MKNQKMWSAWMVQLAVAILVSIGTVTAAAGERLVLDDPLQADTSGTRVGGTFDSGGWRVTGQGDHIFWHLPYGIARGAAEYSIKGLVPNESRAGMQGASELFHMYDYTYFDADHGYDPGYRNNPFKKVTRKQGSEYRVDQMKLVLKIGDEYEEDGTDVLKWDAGHTYLFREEWEPDGAGNTVIRTYRDGVLVKTTSVYGYYRPIGHSVRIGMARMDINAGAPLDAVFSHVKIWDLRKAVPDSTEIQLPVKGEILSNGRAFIRWAGKDHSMYHVRVCTVADPDSGIVWDSGEVTSRRNYAWTGKLAEGGRHYVFVRLGSENGWSGWSASGKWFRVDSSRPSTRPNIVRVQGNSLADNDGPFLGLGVTYMAAMWFCKNDREAFRSDLSFLREKGFNYIRILSEVPGGPGGYWEGRDSSPVGYSSRDEKWVEPWPDYDQQFKDCIDIANDVYGLRTQITIFGGADKSMPEKATRQQHVDRILDLISGREHKIVLVEVANEAWQNGFPGKQGITDLREFGERISRGTPVPVALSATYWDYPDPNASLVEMYRGSSATIATEHFERDVRTSEGGWLPVRHCWIAAEIDGLPPVSSNEPIGPGSSVNSEIDPIKLASAAAFAWTANLPMYVFHSRAGVRRDIRFEETAGIDSLANLRTVLPPDLASWIRNDGKEPGAPFTVFCKGEPDSYWTDVSDAADGCHRNIGGRKGSEFICYPQGILSEGLTLKARSQVAFTVYDPISGEVALGPVVKNAGEQFTLPQGSGAYIINGSFETQPRTLDAPERADASKLNTISESTFDTDAGGWNVKVWRIDQEFADGTMAWKADAGKSGGGMRSAGAGDTDGPNRCTREGGEMRKAISTAGYRDIEVSYDLRVGSLGKAYVGEGTGNCEVDHGLIDEQLSVHYSTDGGANWMEADWLKRSELLSAYRYYGSRIVDLSGVEAANDNPNFALRFRWQFNSVEGTGDYGDLDNIAVRGRSLQEEAGAIE